MTTVRMLVAMTALLTLAACDGPEPRTVQAFMTDEVARTGTLVRCQEMGAAESMRDPECQNARRASERLAALEEERERQAREAEFQRKRAALRERRDREQAAREAAAAAARVEEEQALLGRVSFEDEAAGALTEAAADTVEAPDPADVGDEPASSAPAAGEASGPGQPPVVENPPDPAEPGSQPVRAADPVPED